ncbi:MAG: ATP-grasp domain-containing protein [Desulfovibrio sp.]|nr:ATP-grasp domain-containing protein [Desulfovibrio sp.]
MKKLMILGAASGQMPFITIAKARGYHTIVVSPKGDYPGFDVADKAYYFDTRDKEHILEAARAEKIDAITTDQTDVAVPTVAYVAEKLGLRGIGSDVAEKFTNKYKMRLAAAEAGVSIPKFAHAKNLSEATGIGDSIGYPLIIKPVDNSGSRGIYKIHSTEELKQRFPDALAFSANSEVILEQCLSGPGYLADGFAMGGEYHTLDVGKKENFEGQNLFASSRCIYQSPASDLPEILRKVVETNDKLIRSMKLPFGITHADYIHNIADGKIYLVECAARGGGIFISSHIMPMVSGFNTNEALLEFLVEGTEKKVNPQTLDTNAAAWLCFGLEGGVIENISGLEKLENINEVKNIFIDMHVGEEIKTLRDNTTKLGPILLKSHSTLSIERAMEEIKNTLKIQTRNEAGLHDIIW